eukprot:GILI01008618.1.p1 GENE.GILI01008618.1~~GILI01008618.1.p1  ORF type:complete len:185 (+),score=12.09 GILI01008618.1:55-609(+)
MAGLVPSPLPTSVRVENLIGVTLQVKTSLNDVFEGELFCFDTTTNVLVLKENAEAGQVNYRIVKANHIANITCLNVPSEAVDLSLAPISVQEALAKEEKQLAATRLLVSRLGVGVTAEAQEVFDALSRTLPCSWNGPAILVMGNVKIDPPYLPESVSGSDRAAVERLKRVLELERAKLAKRSVK